VEHSWTDNKQVLRQKEFKMLNTISALSAAIAVAFGTIFFAPSAIAGTHPTPLRAAPVKATPTRLGVGIRVAQNTTSDGTLRNLTSDVLLTLGQKPKPTEEITQNAKISSKSGGTDYRALTLQALANLNVTPEKGSSSEEIKKSISAAIVAGKPDVYVDKLLSQYVDALLNESSKNGTLVVPAEMVSDTGKVDSASLISSLVQKSEAKSQSSLPSAKPNISQKAKPKPKANQTHVVSSGESLAGIAFRYYGRNSAYQLIFEANRDTLASPDKIKTGQKLIIPQG